MLWDRLCAARRIGISVQSGELGGQRGVPPDPVEGLAPGRGGQPCQRLARDPGAWPGLYRCQKGLSGNLLGEIEVAEPGREQGQQAAALLSEHCLDRFACRPIALVLRTRERTHLDAPVLRARTPGRPVERCVQVGDVDDLIAAQVLAGLGERPVGHQPLASIVDLHLGASSKDWSSAGVDVHAGLPEFPLVVHELLRRGAPLLGGGGMPSPSRKPMISSMYFTFALPFVRWFRHLGDGQRTAPSTPGTNKFSFAVVQSSRSAPPDGAIKATMSS